MRWISLPAALVVIFSALPAVADTQDSSKTEDDALRAVSGAISGVAPAYMGNKIVGQASSFAGDGKNFSEVSKALGKLLRIPARAGFASRTILMISSGAAAALTGAFMTGYSIGDGIMILDEKFFDSATRTALADAIDQAAQVSQRVSKEFQEYANSGSQGVEALSGDRAQ
ncbi:MAG: hypothetical protein NDJ89_04330 [Oligoflexia bacterium]|nr:hypothetical protein [Oligoflexia bacterium]